MRYRVVQAVTLVLCLVCSAVAQPPPHPGQAGGGRNLFFEALREVHHESLTKEIFDLLEYPEIRQEIGLSEAHAEVIENSVSQAKSKLMALHEAKRGTAATKDELKAAISETVAPFDKASLELIEQNADLERLLGLYVQARGYRAAVNDEIAERIGMTPEELADFRAARVRAWRTIMEETRKDIEKAARKLGAGRNDLRKTVHKLMDEAEQRLDATLKWELDPSQRAELEKLKGERFKLPDDLFRFPSRGRSSERNRDHERARNSSSTNECCDR